MQHKIREPENSGSIESPLEALQPCGSIGWIAEAARLLNGLGTGIIFAGKTEHGAGHAKSSGSGNSTNPPSCAGRTRVLPGSMPTRFAPEA